MSLFKRAERRQAKLKIALTGPSGSGKTFSALKIAAGLGGKIAVIDTENASASLYAGVVEFDSLELTNYHSDKYIEAINAAVSGGYKVLIIDSITHQWTDLLARKEQFDSRGGNSFTNWSKFTPEHERFKTAIQNADIHIITTMRSKQDYAMNSGDGKKATIQKVGLAPVQREGAEYEYSIVFDVAMDHKAQASKDRTGLFPNDHIFQISEATGEKILSWLSTARPDPVESEEEQSERDLAYSNIHRLYKPYMTAFSKSKSDFVELIKARYRGCPEIRKLSREDLKDLVIFLERELESKNPQVGDFA